MDISWKKLNRKFDANVEALSTIEPREKITSLIEKSNGSVGVDGGQFQGQGEMNYSIWPLTLRCG